MAPLSWPLLCVGLAALTLVTAAHDTSVGSNIRERLYVA